MRPEEGAGRILQAVRAAYVKIQTRENQAGLETDKKSRGTDQPCLRGSMAQDLSSVPEIGMDWS